MSEFRERTYRKRIKSKDLVAFQVAVKETDLWLSADQEFKEETRELVLQCREHIEEYIRKHPDFLTALNPYPEDPFAPGIVKDMTRSSLSAGVGPMASVAGAIARFVGEGLLKVTDQIIVENGGDIFIKVNRDSVISVFAGESPLSEKIGIKIPVRMMPLGICSSSSTVGHSLSRGKADAVCILASSSTYADSAATALCNRIQMENDMNSISDWADQMGDIIGGIAVMGEKMAAWGDIELVAV